MRVSAIGDISGHSAVLAASIRSLGGDPITGELPDDLVVVQVGDLVHKGPDSDGAVRLAERMRQHNPSRWIQLVGNHEMAYLGGPIPPGSDGREVGGDTADTLRRWWQGRLCCVAVAVRMADVEVLVTHAGLSVGCWRDLGEPATALAAAARLNATVGRSDSPAFRAGCLLAGQPDPHAGPCWAEVSQEVYRPWITRRTMPFQQLHGHAAPWDWAAGTFWPDTPADVRVRCRPDHRTRQTTTVLGRLVHGGVATATSIDWRLGTASPPSIWPLWTADGAQLDRIA